MSRDKLSKIIEEAIEEVKMKGIKIVYGDRALADLESRTIMLPREKPSPLQYYRIRHELYHFQVFPKDRDTYRKLLAECFVETGAEFWEERYEVKRLFQIVANAIVNYYAFKNDPHPEIYKKGHDISIKMQKSIDPYAIEMYKEALSMIEKGEKDVVKIVKHLFCKSHPYYCIE